MATSDMGTRKVGRGFERWVEEGGNVTTHCGTIVTFSCYRIRQLEWQRIVTSKNSQNNNSCSRSVVEQKTQNTFLGRPADKCLRTEESGKTSMNNWKMQLASEPVLSQSPTRLFFSPRQSLRGYRRDGFTNWSVFTKVGICAPIAYRVLSVKRVNYLEGVAPVCGGDGQRCMPCRTNERKGHTHTDWSYAYMRLLFTHTHLCLFT